MYGRIGRGVSCECTGTRVWEGGGGVEQMADGRVHGATETEHNLVPNWSRHREMAARGSTLFGVQLAALWPFQ